VVVLFYGIIAVNDIPHKITRAPTSNDHAASRVSMRGPPCASHQSLNAHYSIFSRARTIITHVHGCIH